MALVEAFLAFLYEALALLADALALATAVLADLTALAFFEAAEVVVVTGVVLDDLLVGVDELETVTVEPA
ncbi:MULTISPECIES: hypothetical protein [Bacilli]|uniref:hypothetical protein n=1 Tax=Bacilli TaxID=91061 RepID=UPI001784C008|nr:MULTISPECIES: hypothetical protein [Bacilli]